MALDRDGIRRLAAGGSPNRLLVHLPVMDEDVYVRRLERDERQEVTLWAGAQLGLMDDDGANELNAADAARMMNLVSVGALRYGLVDGHGDPLIESFDEARSVFNGLEEADWEALSRAFGELREDGVVGDVEAGKGSSTSTPTSSPSTQSATSSAAGSPASSPTSPTPN